MATFSGMPSPITDRYESVEDRETYLSGFADEETGNVDTPIGHLYRIGERITCTNSQGFSFTYVYETVSDAKKVFEWAERKYLDWLDSE